MSIQDRIIAAFANSDEQLCVSDVQERLGGEESVATIRMQMDGLATRHALERIEVPGARARYRLGSNEPRRPITVESTAKRVVEASKPKEAPATKEGTNASRILAALKAGPKTAIELADATGIGLPTIYASMSPLNHKRLVEKAGIERGAPWRLANQCAVSAPNNTTATVKAPPAGKSPAGGGAAPERAVLIDAEICVEMLERLEPMMSPDIGARLLNLRDFVKQIHAL